MGKYSKKIQRNVRQVNKNQNGKEQLPVELLEDLKMIREYKDNGRYDEGLQTCIDTFEKYGVKADTAYEVAELYYLSGDYEHCAIWCENTLNIDKNKVGVYILLAKIALLKDQLANVLALIEKIIVMTAGNIKKYKDDMEELLNLVLIDYDEADVQSRYPSVWKALKNIEVEPSHDVQNNSEQTIIRVENNGSNELGNDNHTIAINMKEIQSAIMQAPISLMQKIILCHKQASEFYRKGDFINALEILKLAMSIDNTHNVTLKNMGFILNKLGRSEEAKAYFSKVEDVDLMMLDMLD